MSDKQFTFFEFHFHDGLQIGPRSLDPDAAEELGDATAGESSAAATDSTSTVEESGEPSTPGVLGPLLGLGVLAGLAYAVRKLLAGAEPEGLDALDDIDAGDETTESLESEVEDSVPIEITSPEDEEGGGFGLLIAGAVGLLALFALAAWKLLRGEDEIVVQE